MVTTFAEIVAIAHDEGYGVAANGLDFVFELFEHLYKGGTLYNFEKYSGEHMTALMATVWMDLKRISDEREASNED